VYWFRLWQLLDARHIAVLVVNPQHSKAVKGRKADRKDAKRLAYALKNDTLAGSFVADAEQRALRSYTRGRVGFVRSATAHKNRIHKILRAAGIPLNDVLSDVFCETGLALLRQLATGQRPDTSDAALKKLPMKSRDGVREALDAGFDLTEPDREILALELAALDHAWYAIAQLDRRIQAWLDQRPVWQHAVGLVDSIPGVALQSAVSVVAEIGLDMHRFPTADHLASWSGLCPGQHESAGKNQSGGTPPGNPYVKRVLVECAQTVSARQVAEDHPAYVLNRVAQRLRTRKPWNKAVVAVAHRMILLAWILLRFGEEYDATIHGRYQTRQDARRTRRSIRQLERRGWRVIPPNQSIA
jgi:transposase